MMTKVWGIKVFTKTIMENGSPKMVGVTEAPVNKMMKAYPKEFSFMRHETKRSLRPSARSKKPGAWYMATWVNIQVVKKFSKLHFIKKNLGKNELA